jgi:uncharacterized membrane protein YagU involved in acid resistance
MNTQPTSKAILWGGLMCGVMDMTAACIFYGVLRGNPPIRIMQSVATGLLGAAAYDGGILTAALGLFLHFLIAFTAATVFYFASRKLPVMIRYTILCGLLYGIAVYFFMQLVVVPLSAFPHKGPFTVRGLLTGITIHMFCVGMPISVAARKSAIQETTKASRTPSYERVN